MKPRYFWGSLFVGAFLGLVLIRLGYRPKPTSDRWYQRLAEMGYNPDFGMGILFGLFAVALTTQTFITLRQGFVYCWPFQRRVYLTDEPRRFRFWRRIQLFLIAVLALIGLLFVSGIFGPPTTPAA